MTIIDLAERRRRIALYQETLTDTADLLEVFSRDLFTAALNVATSGPWREWDEQVPSGSMMEFDPEDLRECGDEHVASLIELLYQVEDVRLAFIQHE